MYSFFTFVHITSFKNLKSKSNKMLFEKDKKNKINKAPLARTINGQQLKRDVSSVPHV